MKRTKYVLIAFAVFASLLMLMTPTMARPIQENTILNSIEQQQEQIINEITDLFSRLENDREIKRLTTELENDRELTQITTNIDTTANPEEKIANAATYLDAMQNKEAYKQLEKYITTQYATDLSSISAQTDSLAKDMQSYYNQQETTTEENIEPLLIPVGVIPTSSSSSDDGIPTEDSTTTTKDSGLETVFEENDQFGYIPGDEIEQNDDFIEYDDLGNNFDGLLDYPLKGDEENLWGQTEAQWAGFMRNMDGDIYVPGEGWISPDDPNYDDWLNLEDLLQNLGLSLGDIGGFLLLLGVGLIFLWQYIFAFALLCMLPASILQSLGLTGAFWIALGNGLLDLSIIIELAAAASVLLGFILLVLSGDIPVEP